MLPAAVESALNQDFPESEREIIVVDDASTDDTPGVLRRYGDKIRVLRHAVNRGQGEAQHTAILAARGEIIAGLDSDDVWLPRKLSRVAEAFGRFKNAVLVTHQVRWVDRSLRRIKKDKGVPCIQKDRLIDSRSESILHFSRDKGVLYGPLPALGGGSAWAAKKSPLIKGLQHGRPPPMNPEQFYFYLALADGGAVAVLSERLGLYRRHRGNSISWNPSGVQERLKLLEIGESPCLRALEVLDPARCPSLAKDLRAMARRRTAETLLLKSRAGKPVSAEAPREKYFSSQTRRQIKR
jgi:glycosyltransferase involved in cell wall biosynthesis